MGRDGDVTPRWERAALAAVLLAGLVLRLYYARVWHTGFDEAWNLFYSVIGSWDVTWAELKSHAHPPLSVAWIWLFLRLGDPPFWARMAFILPGMAVAALTYRGGRALGMLRPVPLLLALILALCPVWVNMSVCVRSYSLMSAFLAVSALSFVEIARRPDQVSGRQTGTFVLAALLAMWTEYPAIFAVLAMVLSPVVLAAAGLIPWRSLGRLLLRQGGWGLVLAAGSAGLAAYIASVDMTVKQAHVVEFYRAAGEGLLPFAWRGLAGVVERLTLLSWFAWLGSTLATVVFTLWLAALLALECRRGRDPARAATVVATLLLLGGLAVLGAWGRYPFGGQMRHQAVLFPFLVLLFGQSLDRLLRVPPVRRWAGPVCAGLALLSALFCVRGLGGPALEEFPSSPLFEAEYAALQTHVGGGRPLYLNTFNQVGYFANTMSRRWRCVGRPEPGVFLYAVDDGRGGRQLALTDRRGWMFDGLPGDREAQRLCN